LRAVLFPSPEGTAPRHAPRIALEFCQEAKRRVEAKQANLIVQGNKEGPAACQSLFLDPPWWSRAWILQEVIHSGDVVVYFGNTEPVPIDDICDAYRYYEDWKLIHNEGYAARMARLTREEAPSHLLPSGNPNLQELYKSWIRSNLRTSDIRSLILDLRNAAKNPSAKDVTPYVAPFPPNLSGLLTKFRDQQATDARDLIYAYIGMAAPGSNGTGIAVDYLLSKKILYTRIARALLKNVLIILLWIESPNRPVEPHRDLPSWVPDYTIKQMPIPRLQVRFHQSFDADLGFPPVDQEPRFQDAVDSEILVLRGIYVAVVTEVHDTRVTDVVEYVGQDTVRLIKYDQDPDSRYRNHLDAVPVYIRILNPVFARILYAVVTWTMFSYPGFSRILYAVLSRTLHPVFSRILYPVYSRILYPAFLRIPYLQKRSMACRDTSWGPCHAAIGDIIIVAAGCKIPLVLRKAEDGKYLFVGGCWLIDSEPQMDISGKVNTREESGISPIMFGSACKGLPENWKVEEFHVC
jgi:hypothetical protein